MGILTVAQVLEGNLMQLPLLDHKCVSPLKPLDTRINRRVLVAALNTIYAHQSVGKVVRI